MYELHFVILCLFVNISSPEFVYGCEYTLLFRPIGWSKRLYYENGGKWFTTALFDRGTYGL